MSSRERNRAKRKEKSLAGSNKRIKFDNEKVVMAYKKELEFQIPDNEHPMQYLILKLLKQLFSPFWEVRHGAALALREMLKNLGGEMGKIDGLDIERNITLHQDWCKDVSVRILSVLALDRFTDFVGDNPQIPVREVCAQVLGVVAKFASRELIFDIITKGLISLIRESKISVELVGQSWGIRLAAFTGLKYILAVRTDLLEFLLKDNDGEFTPILLTILDGLLDLNDDVRVVAALTLAPIVDEIVSIFSGPKLFEAILVPLWNSLHELDDLTSATVSIMDLISKLIIRPQISSIIQNETCDYLAHLIPQIYPFFRHAISSARASILESLFTFASLSFNSSSGISWISPDLLNLIFQNFFLEENCDIVEISLKIWNELVLVLKKNSNLLSSDLSSYFDSFLPGLFTLLMFPIGSRIDPGQFIYFTSEGSTISKLGRFMIGKVRKVSGNEGLNISPHDKAMAMQDFTVVAKSQVMFNRVAASKALGELLFHIFDTNPPQKFVVSISQIIRNCLSSPYAYNRIFSSIVIQYWFRNFHENYPARSLDDIEVMNGLFVECNDQLISAHEGNQLLFVEIQSYLVDLRQQTEALFRIFSSLGCQMPLLPSLPFDSNPINSELGPIFTVHVAETISSSLFAQFLDKIPSKITSELLENLQNKNANLRSSLNDFYLRQESIEITYMSSLASLLVSAEYFPGKQNHLIRSLLNSIKKDSDFNFQKRSAEALSDLLFWNSQKGGKSLTINDKIIKNLSSMLCNDPELVVNEPTNVEQLKVMTWEKIQLDLEVKKESSKKSKTSKKSSIIEDVNGSEDEEFQSDQSIEFRGGIIVFKILCKKFGATLLKDISSIWSLIGLPLITYKNDPATVSSTNSAINSMMLLQYMIPFLDKAILDTEIQPLIIIVCELSRHNISLVRYCAAICLGTMCCYITFPSMKAVIDHILPCLSESNDLINRLGASEAIYQILELMKDDVLPYIVFLIVPILRRMSDPDSNVRFLCSNIFAKLVKLVPLEKGIPNPDGFSSEMIKLKDEERKFMGQLVGSEKVEDFQLNVEIKAELRPYQKDGVNWLAFLNRYGLHGILCDGNYKFY